MHLTRSPGSWQAVNGTESPLCPCPISPRTSSGRTATPNTSMTYLIIITAVCQDTFILPHRGSILVSQFIAASFPVLAINVNHSEQPAHSPAYPLAAEGPLIGHGVLRCGTASLPPGRQSPIQRSPTSGTDSIICVEERAEHCQPLWRKPEAQQGAWLSGIYPG